MIKRRPALYVPTPPVDLQVLEQLKSMGRELDQDPTFVTAMLRRLDQTIEGSLAKHDH